MKFARYRIRKLRTVYYNGCGYVVMRDEYPHTTWQPEMVTRQGSRTWVGVRQGTCDSGGFAFRRYVHPDTDPR